MDSAAPGLLLIVLGFAALSAGLFLARRRGRRPERERPGTFGAPPEDLRDELERLVADLRQAAREEVARLDTKIRLLERLLPEADRRIRELEARTGRAAPAAEPPSPAAPNADSASPLQRQVYDLQDRGKEVGEICRETGLEKGEVELLLGLRGLASRDRPDAPRGG